MGCVLVLSLLNLATTLYVLSVEETQRQRDAKLK
jgi:hypothetical protein